MIKEDVYTFLLSNGRKMESTKNSTLMYLNKVAG